jgi:hypothetical protein
VSPELPVELERFFERALARNPEARFRRVTVLAEELGAIAEGRAAAREEPALEMEPFDAPRRSSLPPDASTRRELAGRSTPTLAVGTPEPVDTGVASTIIRRPRPARWYALGAVAVLVAVAVVWLTRADEPAPAASAPPPPAPVAAPAPSPSPTPVEIARPRAEPSATPRPPPPRAANAQPSAPRPSASRDPNFGLPVKSK